METNPEFQIPANEERATFKTASELGRYRISWVNRFNDWVERLPWHPWITYLGIGLGLILIQGIVFWVEGAVAAGTFLANQIFLPAVIAFFLGLFHFLDRRAGAALETLRPALKVSETKVVELHFRLTRLPGVPALLAGLLALLFVFLTEISEGAYLPAELQGHPYSAATLRSVYLICWWVFGAMIYHTVFQLRAIHRIYTRYTIVDLFKMEPLYAFANLSAITAGSIIVIPYGFMVINQFSPLADPITLFLFLGILLIAGAAFLLPQLGIHRLQMAEKNRLIGEVNQRIVAVIQELHQNIDENTLEPIGSLNTALTTLELEKGLLERISTWPWQPETVRWLMSALLLPLAMLILQIVLSSF